MGVTSYYNYAKLFSYNATINGVIGGRGLGKTFGSKIKGTNDALKACVFEERSVEVVKRGKSTQQIHVSAEPCTNQFIYLRRYKEELALAKATFFADYEYKYPEWDFRVHGWEAQASPHKYDGMEKRPWATIGYFVALSVARNFKSVQFPHVKTIIFDEFIIEKGGQYLPEEASKLINFYNTVDRSKDKTRLLMLANSVTITNPYFIQYQVEPRKADKNGFIRQAGGYMLWHFPDSKEFESEVFATAFGKFIAETDPEYADYAVNNKFRDDTDNLVEVKDYRAKYLLTLQTKQGSYSVWYKSGTSMYYCQEKRPNSDEDIIVLEPTLMGEGKRLMTFTDKPMQMLRTAFRHDRMRFDKASTTNAFMEIFKR